MGGPPGKGRVWGGLRGEGWDPRRAMRACGELGRRPAQRAHRAAPATRPGARRAAAPPPPALLPSAPAATETTAREEGKVTPGTSAGISPGAVMTPSRGATKRRSLRSDVPAAALSIRKWPPPAAAAAPPAPPPPAAPIRSAPVANQTLPRVQKPLAPLETAAPSPSPSPSRAAPSGWAGARRETVVRRERRRAAPSGLGSRSHSRPQTVLETVYHLCHRKPSG